ncbi:MAG: queuosine precursor transporter [Alteromonadaceae bacterium]|nr:queuosine precursor transporter [Alteromonadaceae bacterium]
MAAFVAVLLCSNLIGPAKIAEFNGVIFGAGVLFFPFSYIFGDVLTEVYGYKRARRVVWTGFAALGFAAFMSWAVLALPAAENWGDQAALETAFGSTWRIVLASLIGFWAGELTNSYVMAKMKIKTQGKHLYARTIGSTVVGQAVDSVFFYSIAFLGIWSVEQVLLVMVSNYILKVLWEALMTPFTYKLVNFLKRAEKIDVYDTNTDFTPFSVSVSDEKKT